MNHIQKIHSKNVVEITALTIPKTITIDDYIPKKISKEAIDIHGWLRQVVMEDQPFRIVESLQYQEFSHYYEVISQRKQSEQICPIPPIVERLFSTTKLIKCDNRNHMRPANLDRLLFLRYNFK
jgi:uncharacterized protein YeaO (DUF488 family)